MNPALDESFDFPATRAEALTTLEAFLPRCGAYAAKRNQVEPGHRNVSQLSPALRTRVLLEREVCAMVLKRYPDSRVEKFIQEVWWRLYWKSWLEMRPGVWTDYRDRLAQMPENLRERARKVGSGGSGVAIMDHFACELAETGYLHNHARMWFASFWVHAEGLPWELGADFFMQHLLDGDAASNTLSWRWVAGLHTPGKTYLVSRANIERCCHPDLLSGNAEGLERLEEVTARLPDTEALANPPAEIPPGATLDPADLTGRWGLWIHDDDLSPERSELAPLRPAAVRAWIPGTRSNEEKSSDQIISHRSRAIADAVERGGAHFEVEADHSTAGDPGEALAQWAEEKDLGTVVALRPCVGPNREALEEVRRQLSAVGRRLVLVRRSEDEAVMRFATGGFFGFWKKTAKLRQPIEDA